MGTGKNTTVADIMNPKLLYLRKGDRPALARGPILKFGITAVPVLEDDHRPVGVVSLRDLVLADEDLSPSPVVHTVRSDASILEGARALADTGMHHLVVVDPDGVAVGMVSAVDFVRAFADVAARHPKMFDHFH